MSKKKCATWCGGGCTEEGYTEAMDYADWLVQRLGENWHPVVTENMGWYSKAISNNGTITVYGNKYGREYTAYLNEPGHIGGRWVKSGATPKAAVRAVLKMAMQERDTINSIIEASKEAIR